MSFILYNKYTQLIQFPFESLVLNAHHFQFPTSGHILICLYECLSKYATKCDCETSNGLFLISCALRPHLTEHTHVRSDPQSHVWARSCGVCHLWASIISLSIMFSSSTVYLQISFFVTAEQNFIINICPIFPYPFLHWWASRLSPCPSCCGYSID